MGSNSSAAKRYIRSVRDTLSCSGPMKKQIVLQIRDSVDDYMIQNPDADFEMIQTHFGTPQEIAESYVNEQDAAGLLKEMSIKKKVLIFVASMVATMILFWVGSVAYATHQTQKSMDRFITEEIN